MERITLQVGGMSCGHCVRAVEQALGAVGGTTVEKVEIGTAHLTYDPQVTTVGALIDAVADAGYDAQEAPAR